MLDSFISFQHLVLEDKDEGVKREITRQGWQAKSSNISCFLVDFLLTQCHVSANLHTSTSSSWYFEVVSYVYLKFYYKSSFDS